MKYNSQKNANFKESETATNIQKNRKKCNFSIIFSYKFGCKLFHCFSCNNEIDTLFSIMVIDNLASLLKWLAPKCIFTTVNLDNLFSVLQLIRDC